MSESYVQLFPGLHLGKRTGVGAGEKLQGPFPSSNEAWPNCKLPWIVRFIRGRREELLTPGTARVIAPVRARLADVRRPRRLTHGCTRLSCINGSASAELSAWRSLIAPTAACCSGALPPRNGGVDRREQTEEDVTGRIYLWPRIPTPYKMENRAQERLSVLSRQLTSGETSSSFASVTPGTASSYARIHGAKDHRRPIRWVAIPIVEDKELLEVRYEKADGEGIAKITINRPEKRNAFTPRTGE